VIKRVGIMIMLTIIKSIGALIKTKIIKRWKFYGKNWKHQFPLRQY